jgi:glyoxylate/hydroxypyruvate reductase A
MDVLVATASGARRWRDALARCLPEARIHVWPESPQVVDFIAAWRPPPELFERVAVRRAIANLGAGVDALLSVPTLPTGVPIVRLEDAGMAEQMAEYVALATLAAYREQQAYAHQQRHRRWKQRERLDKRTFVVGLLGLGVLAQAVAEALAAVGFPVPACSCACSP